MSWWLPHNFEQKMPYLRARLEIIKAVRGFFEARDYMEVQTPVLQDMPTADTHIHGFQTILRNVNLKPMKNVYLHASPEFAMKKLLVAGCGKIYQICPVFRNGDGAGEARSPLHSPEFTMLEWYRAGASYRDLMDETVDFLRHVAEKAGIKTYTHTGKQADPFLNWNIISVLEAFDKYIKIDLEEYLEDTELFRTVLTEKNIRTATHDRWDDLFHRAMAEKIESHLGQGAPCILYDYPACMAALARKKPEDPRFAERFEVYMCGMELANGFSELTDAGEQRARFEADMALKEEIYGESYPVDEGFLKALEHGMPECSGIALGLDRLVMLATGAEDITQVQWG